MCIASKIQLVCQMFTINCKGKILSTETPLVMGIINVTPDSFYQGHLDEGQEAIAAIAEKMVNDGADILDIGGQSTRPGSERISAKVEMARVIPFIEKIHGRFPDMVISIDTYHSEVAAAAVNAGASIVNDISGGDMDKLMIPAVASLQVPYICMHMKGTPDTMQHHISYNGLLKEILDHFIHKIELCRHAGIHDIIIDPGFGFGKTISHNFELLKNLEVFKILERPILAGHSRKSTIYKTLSISAEDALNGTTVLNTIAVTNGADILRVHDVKEAKEVVTLIKAYNAVK